MEEVFNTQILPCDDESIEKAAKVIKSGGIVGMPTETVYGLAADAFNSCAVEKIFKAKGRPQDNPLILHISKLSMLDGIVQGVSPLAKRIISKFWPGPLTVIFPKSESVLYSVTAGLETVAVRFPAHQGALKLIDAAGTPLAAPSANISGKPSPTSAQHVYDDLKGKIEIILDGGKCKVGLESTVISLNGNSVTILRPGKITAKDLNTVAENVYIDAGVTKKLDDNVKAPSPGMKYKHYAPSADVIILDGSFDKFSEYVNSHKEEGTYALVFDGEENMLSVPCLTLGDKSDENAHAALLFESLRRLDSLKALKVYARMPSKEGVGLAVFNRLIRAAAFRIVKL